MKPQYQQWEELRANWVNGNLSDCRNWFKNTPKNTALSVILAAALHGYANDTGDMIDLIEMLKSLED